MSVKHRLRRSVALVFLLVLVVRITTTFPILRTLTGMGVAEPTAKALSQVPTVLFMVGLVVWFGWIRDVGLRPDEWWPRESWWAFLPVLLPVVAIPLLGLQLVSTDAVLWLLADAAFVAIWEELYFRGVMLEQVRAKLPSPRTAVLVAGGLFGLVHLTNVSALGAEPTFVAVQVVFAGLSGVGMGAVRLRTGSLWPLVVAHFLVDGPERLVFGEQATTGTPVLLGLLLLFGALYFVYGWVATGRMEADPTLERGRPAPAD